MQGDTKPTIILSHLCNKISRRGWWKASELAVFLLNISHHGSQLLLLGRDFYNMLKTKSTEFRIKGIKHPSQKQRQQVSNIYKLWKGGEKGKIEYRVPDSISSAETCSHTPIWWVNQRHPLPLINFLLIGYCWLPAAFLSLKSQALCKLFWQRFQDWRGSIWFCLLQPSCGWRLYVFLVVVNLSIPFSLTEYLKNAFKDFQFWLKYKLIRFWSPRSRSLQPNVNPFFSWTFSRTFWGAFSLIWHKCPPAVKYRLIRLQWSTVKVTTFNTNLQ